MAPFICGVARVEQRSEPMRVVNDRSKLTHFVPKAIV